MEVGRGRRPTFSGVQQRSASGDALQGRRESERTRARGTSGEGRGRGRGAGRATRGGGRTLTAPILLTVHANRRLAASAYRALPSIVRRRARSALGASKVRLAKVLLAASVRLRSSVTLHLLPSSSSPLSGRVFRLFARVRSAELRRPASLYRVLEVSSSKTTRRVLHGLASSTWRGSGGPLSRRTLANVRAMEAGGRAHAIRAQLVEIHCSALSPNRGELALEWTALPDGSDGKE